MEDRKDELQEDFSLEDILREFGSGADVPAPAEEITEEAIPDEPAVVPATEEADVELPQANEAPAEPAVQEESEDDVLVFNSAEADPASDESIPDDTIRMQTKKLEPVTIREDEDDEAESTKPFTPIGGDDEPLPPIPEEPKEEAPEAFSEGWEPEYEEPIGDYEPPKPIEFPRSKLIKMRRKIVAGPEKRYYELSAMGLGKLQICIFLSFLVLLMGVVSVVLYQLDMVQANRMRLLVFGEIFAMLVCALLGNRLIIDGLISIFKGKFTQNTLLLCSFGVCIADAVTCLREQRVPFCAAFCLQVTMALLSAYQRRNLEMAQMDTLRKSSVLYSVIRQDAYYDGKAGFRKADGDIDDFMQHYQEPVGPEKALNLYSLLAFLLSAAVGITIGLTSSWSNGTKVWSAFLLAAVPATSFIAVSRPAAVLERKLHRFGAVICGWKGALAGSKPGAVAVEDSDLFPAGAVKLNGVKFYGELDRDLVIAYSTSLMNHSGSPLIPLFASLQQDRTVQQFPVENIRHYDNGIGGEIQEESVLIGTLQFMQDMGVTLPEGTRVNQALYVAIDLELSCVVAMNYNKSRAAAAGLSSICSYRRLTPVLLSGNFMLDKDFIRTRFNVNTKRFAIPEIKQRFALAETPVPEEDQMQICALTTQEGLAPMAFAITGSRALRRSARFGAAIHIIGGIIGMGIVATLTALSSYELLSPANLLLFELVWALPGVLITEGTRAI